MKTNMDSFTRKCEIIMCQPDESIRLEVRMEEDTVWLSFSARLPPVRGIGGQQGKDRFFHHSESFVAIGEDLKNKF